MNPHVLAQTLRNIASKVARSESPSRKAVASDLRVIYNSIRLSAKVEEPTEEEFRSAFQSTPQEDLMEALDDEYPITVDNLWDEFFKLSNSESDKKRSGKILKAIGL